jgi:hypothetical protein
MSSTNEILSAITDAHTAYQRVPVLEGNITVLETQLSDAHNIISIKTETISSLEATITELRQAKAKAEAELEAATFRELLAEEKLDSIKGLLKSVGDQLVETDKEPSPVVTPPTEPDLTIISTSDPVPVSWPEPHTDTSVSTNSSDLEHIPQSETIDRPWWEKPNDLSSPFAEPRW